MMLAMKRTLNINCSWAEYSVAKVLMVMVGVMLMVTLVRKKWQRWRMVVVLYESSKSRWGFEFCYGP